MRDEMVPLKAHLLLAQPTILILSLPPRATVDRLTTDSLTQPLVDVTFIYNPQTNKSDWEITARGALLVS